MTAVLAGQYFSHRLTKRVAFLEKTELMLTFFLNEISYLATPSTELISKLATRSEFKDLTFLKYCNNGIGSGDDFNKAWLASLDNSKAHRYLTDRDLSVIESFGNAFGTTDTEGQKTICEFYIEEIKNNLTDARNKKACYANLFTGLGIMSGIGLIIVLM